MPRNPLDVLAQQIVAMAVMDRWTVDELLDDGDPGRRRTRRSAARPSRASSAMLAGAYPSDEFAELKPRIVWDRVDRRHRGPARRPGRRGHERRDDPGSRAVRRLPRRRGRDARPAGRRARRGDGLREPGRRGDHARRQQLADRGDRARPGHRHARRPACPASCRSGTATRSAGRSSWAGARRVRRRGRGRPGARRRDGPQAVAGRLCESHDLDELAAENLVAYLEDEREVAGALPTDRRIVVERFRDELGDWRLVLLTPFGGRVHAPWSLALEARLGERLGAEVQTIWSDDGIAIRLPEGDARRRRASCCSPIPTRSRTSSSARSPTRRCSRRGSARTPRGRCSCRVAGRARGRRSGSSASGRPTCSRWPSRYGTLPDPRRDVPRVPVRRLRPAGAARGPGRRRPPRDRRPLASRPPRASPFASSLLFDYVAAYMYEGDAPLAERRARR